MPNDAIEAFLTHLAVKQHVAASTHNQALSALLFLYRQVLQQPMVEVTAVRANGRTIMICTHAPNRDGPAVRSPLDL